MTNRYHRQELFFTDGRNAQERLKRARVLIVGCGALGTVSAEQLTRAGVGHLRIVDRDVVEWTNLHRQIGFTEKDAQARDPKVDALQRHLAQINSEIEVDARAVDFNFANALQLATDCDLLLDGLDNLQSRFLLNDVSYRLGIPWIYCGAIGGDGHVQYFSGREGPCLRCQLPELPPAGTIPTCDTHGVVAPATGVAASWQSGLALKHLTNPHDTSLAGQKAILSPWRGEARVVTAEPDPDCAVCVDGKFEFLTESRADRVTQLCGRKAVQVLPPDANTGFDLDRVAERLQRLGHLQRFPQLLRFQSEDFLLTLFADGRAVFDGLTDRDLARSLYARFVGH